jgi:hypothetical protein
MYYCWHISFSISVTFDLLMASSIQIIVYKYARDKKYSCDTSYLLAVKAMPPLTHTPSVLSLFPSWNMSEFHVNF